MPKKKAVVLELVSHSPITQKAEYVEVGMPFSTALASVIDGKLITRPEWEEDYHGVLQDGKLMLHKPDGQLYYWILSDGDILATDWIVFE